MTTLFETLVKNLVALLCAAAALAPTLAPAATQQEFDAALAKETDEVVRIALLDLVARIKTPGLTQKVVQRLDWKDYSETAKWVKLANSTGNLGAVYTILNFTLELKKDAFKEKFRELTHQGIQERLSGDLDHQLAQLGWKHKDFEKDAKSVGDNIANTLLDQALAAAKECGGALLTEHKEGKLPTAKKPLEDRVKTLAHEAADKASIRAIGSIIHRAGAGTQSVD